jgi:hypothetical protein
MEACREIEKEMNSKDLKKNLYLKHKKSFSRKLPKLNTIKGTIPRKHSQYYISNTNYKNDINRV